MEKVSASPTETNTGKLWSEEMAFPPNTELRNSGHKGTLEYKAAKNDLLNDIVPQEDPAKASKLVDVICLHDQWSSGCLFRACCCFYYACCCCLCCETSKEVTKQTFVTRFEKWLNLDSKLSSDKVQHVSTVMLRLYAHQPGAIKSLESCRINPNFSSQFRDDLEFFVPQLCSFYLKGNLEDHKQLFDVITMASSASFFFSHRVWFFFHSAMFQEFSH